MLENAYSIVFIICVVNIIYVTFFTMRMILTIKGRMYLAAMVSVFEVSVYILGLSIVLDNLDGIQNIIAYAVGFAIGVIVGSKIEERLALGYMTINVVSSDPSLNFSSYLREKGFGVTSWMSSGMEGNRLSMQILTSRKRERDLYNYISEIDPKAFIVAYEPKYVKGGFWVRQVRRENNLFFSRAKERLIPDTTISEKVIEDDKIVKEYIDEENNVI